MATSLQDLNSAVNPSTAKKQFMVVDGKVLGNEMDMLPTDPSNCLPEAPIYFLVNN